MKGEGHWDEGWPGGLAQQGPPAKALAGPSRGGRGGLVSSSPMPPKRLPLPRAGPEFQLSPGLAAEAAGGSGPHR